MKVYDVWCSDLEKDYPGEDNWLTAYGDSLEAIHKLLDDMAVCDDWIIIENELPF